MSFNHHRNHNGRGNWLSRASVSVIVTASALSCVACDANLDVSQGSSTLDASAALDGLQESDGRAMARTMGAQSTSSQPPSDSLDSQPVADQGMGLEPRATLHALKDFYNQKGFEYCYKNVILLKLDEGHEVRARGGRLVSPEGKGSSIVGAINRRLDRLPRQVSLPLHTLREDLLEDMKVQGELMTGQALPDLNLWFQLFVDPRDDASLRSVVRDLNALPGVELAYVAPIPVQPSMDDGEGLEGPPADRLPWPTQEIIAQRELGLDAETQEQPEHPQAVASPAMSPAAFSTNYEPSQDYGEPAPVGIDVDYVRANFWDSYGESWGYTDVEYAWNRSHADLASIWASSVLVNGTPASSDYTKPDQARNIDHGTAVVGQISSTDNGWGTTGLAPSSAVRLSTHNSTTGTTLAGAVSTAAAQFFGGAVVVLEAQVAAGFDCNGDGKINYDEKLGLADWAPAEWDPATLQSVKTASANQRVVVAAAGNGNCNLDGTGFKGMFNVNDATKDSGAILVGAGEKLTLNKASFSNYGQRVDTQSEGDWQVTTTGYGSLYSASGTNYYYTSTFAGTSSATPIVSGGILAMQGILFNNFGSYYGPKEIRDLLRRDGTPQGTGGKIGPRPDLKKQIEHTISRHLQLRSSDFDGDGKSDYAVWSPSSGVWTIKGTKVAGSTTTLNWGQKGDIPMAANVMGDSRSEPMVFRPSSGTWYVAGWDGNNRTVQWGYQGDVPVPADVDGDGYSELIVYRPLMNGNTPTFYINKMNGTTWSVAMGQPGDTPLARDINGDKKDDLIVYRATTGTYYVRNSATGVISSYAVGTWGDIPVIFKRGSYINLGAWRPSTGTIYYRYLTSASVYSMAFGLPGDVPRVMDSNNDGYEELVVYRPSKGQFINQEKGTVTLGAVGDIAIAR